MIAKNIFKIPPANNKTFMDLYQQFAQKCSKSVSHGEVEVEQNKSNGYTVQIKDGEAMQPEARKMLTGILKHCSAEKVPIHEVKRANNLIALIEDITGSNVSLGNGDAGENLTNNSLTSISDLLNGLQEEYQTAIERVAESNDQQMLESLKGMSSQVDNMIDQIAELISGDGTIQESFGDDDKREIDMSLDDVDKNFDKVSKIMDKGVKIGIDDDDNSY